MKYIISVDFLLPLICIALLLFFISRLYSLRNMSIPKVISEFNVAFALGKTAYSLSVFLLIAYIILSFINGIYLLPIITSTLGFVIGRLLASNKKLTPSTTIPYQIMTINCISISVVFVIFLMYIINI